MDSLRQHDRSYDTSQEDEPKDSDEFFYHASSNSRWANHKSPSPVCHQLLLIRFDGRPDQRFNRHRLEDNSWFLWRKCWLQNSKIFTSRLIPLLIAAISNKSSLLLSDYSVKSMFSLTFSHSFTIINGRSSSNADKRVDTEILQTEFNQKHNWSWQTIQSVWMGREGNFRRNSSPGRILHDIRIFVIFFIFLWWWHIYRHIREGEEKAFLTSIVRVHQAHWLLPE